MDLLELHGDLLSQLTTALKAMVSHNLVNTLLPIVLQLASVILYPSIKLLVTLLVSFLPQGVVLLQRVIKYTRDEQKGNGAQHARYRVDSFHLLLRVVLDPNAISVKVLLNEVSSRVNAYFVIELDQEDNE